MLLIAILTLSNLDRIEKSIFYPTVRWDNPCWEFNPEKLNILPSRIKPSIVCHANLSCAKHLLLILKMVQNDTNYFVKKNTSFDPEHNLMYSDFYFSLLICGLFLWQCSQFSCNLSCKNKYRIQPLFVCIKKKNSK